MSVITCRRCGASTNTAICDHIDSPDDLADRCYGRWVDDKWERGCAYDDPDADTFVRGFVDRLINNPKETSDGTDPQTNP